MGAGDLLPDSSSGKEGAGPAAAAATSCNSCRQGCSSSLGEAAAAAAGQPASSRKAVPRLVHQEVLGAYSKEGVTSWGAHIKHWLTGTGIKWRDSSPLGMWSYYPDWVPSGRAAS